MLSAEYFACRLCVRRIRRLCFLVEGEQYDVLLVNAVVVHVAWSLVCVADVVVPQYAM